MTDVVAIDAAPLPYTIPATVIMELVSLTRLCGGRPSAGDRERITRTRKAHLRPTRHDAVASVVSLTPARHLRRQRLP